MDTENRPTAFREKGVGGLLSEQGDVIRQKTNNRPKLIDTDKRMLVIRGKGLEEVEEGKEGINCDRRRFDLGW